MSASQADQMQTEGELMQTLETQSRTAPGQLAAVQAGNAMGLAAVSQLRQLQRRNCKHSK